LLSLRSQFDELDPQGVFCKAPMGASRSRAIVMELQHRIFVASIGGR
jgi:hypothetical protein